MRSEFDFIQHIKKKYGLNHIGDDCAVLPKDPRTDLVVTADMLVEDIDFRLDWTAPNFLGHKALAVSLSDIGAMGGEPKWAMLSIGAPRKLWDSDFLESLFDGYARLAQKFGTEIIGGDVSRTPDKLVLDSVVGGEVPKGEAVLRSGAQPGNAIYVSGSLGGAAAGLQLLESGVRYGPSIRIWERKLLSKQLHPWPSSASDGPKLRELGATAMIDLSDGLSSDLSHLCRASGVGATIFGNSIPVESNMSGLRAPLEHQLDLALSGGEDLELLFTVDEKKFSNIELDRFFRIGEVTANDGIIEIIVDEEARLLEPKGYRHF